MFETQFRPFVTGSGQAAPRRGRSSGGAGPARFCRSPAREVEPKSLFPPRPAVLQCPADGDTGVQ